MTIRSGQDYHALYDLTVDTVRQANEYVHAYAVVGVHPAEFIGLAESMGIETAYQVVREGLEIAAKYVAEGKAIAIKSGRPHYPVSPELWERSNALMRYAMDLCVDEDCALQLHTESEPGTFESISAIASEQHLPAWHTIKHFSPPAVRECESLNVFPSVIASKGALEEALSQGTRFMLETDYCDDPNGLAPSWGLRPCPGRRKRLYAMAYRKRSFLRFTRKIPRSATA